MNRIHKIVWSAVKEKWIVVSEKAGATGCPIVKGGLLSLAALLSLGTPAFALAPGELPAGGAITAGSGTIAAAGNAMTVTQTSQKLIADWKTFNIGAQASVRFDQPGATAAALNRIHDLNPSQIMGQLSSNGQVFLLNQSGIIFGKTAQVNVGGLVGTSLDMADSDFLAGKYQLTKGGGAGSVMNQGSINAIPGGVVALIAPQVENQGTITADGGSVALLAGNKVTVDFGGDGLISYVIDEGAVNSQAANSGLIKADGGLAVMSAQAADELTSAAVNNSGIIEARTLGEREGKIVLLSDMKTGKTTVGGTLDASAPDGGNGGFVETSGANVTVASNAVIDTRAANGNTGTWLLDPVDFIVAASGGNITGTALGTALGSNNVTIHTDALGSDTSTDKYGTSGNGDIFVNDPVSWSSNKILTLNAWRNIKVNSAITVSGAGTLSLLYGQGASPSITANTSTFTASKPIILASSAHFNTIFGSGGDLKNYTVITTQTALQGMLLDGTNYVLGNDLTLTGSFMPIGGSIENTIYANAMAINPLQVLEPYAFRGSFEGAGHTISNLTINLPSTTFVGMFALPFNIGSTTPQTIENLMLSGANVTGELQVGTLAGFIGPSYIVNNVSISNCTVNGQSQVGGMAGGAAGLIKSSSVTGVVVTQTGSYSSFSIISGIGENNGGNQNFGSIGGLLGSADGGSIINSFVSGTVTAGNDSSGIGGLAGEISYNTDMGGTNLGIINSHSSATVSMGSRVDDHNTNSNSGSIGGLVGGDYGLAISNSYSTGDVNAGSGIDGSHSLNNVGGLVGQVGRRDSVPTIAGSITQSFSTGTVTVTGYNYQVGGLVGGLSASNVSQSYSTGRVKENGSGGGNMGGLVGSAGNWNSTSYTTTISDSYSLSNVVVPNGANMAGGFIGSLWSNGGTSTISNSYSTGMVAVPSGGSIGGFAGQNNGSILNSYWNTETSGIASAGIGNGTNSGVIAKTTSQLMSGLQQDWSSGTWGINSTTSYPYFKWQYGSTPEVFSGALIISSGGSASGKNIVIADNGTVIGGAVSTANGFYYTLMPYDTALPGTNLLFFLNGATYSDLTPMRANNVSYVNNTEQCTGHYLFARIIYVTRGNDTQPLSPTVAMNYGLGGLGSSSYSSDILYTASSGNVTLNADTIFHAMTSPGMTITGNVNASGHAIGIASEGPVTQSGSIIAGWLGLNYTGSASPSFTLTATGNQFGIVAGNSNGGNISLTDSIDFSIQSLTSPYFGAINGLNAGSGNVTLTNSHTVTQTSPITAGSLELLGGGDFNFGTQSNTIYNLAGNVGSVSINNSRGISVGTVNSTHGLTASGNVNLLLAGTGNSVVNDALSASTLTINDAGSIDQNAPITAGSLEMLGGGNYDFSGSGNYIGTIAGIVNNLSINDASSIIVGQVNTTQGLMATNNVTIQTIGNNSDITLNQGVSGSSGNVVLAAGGNFINNFGVGAIVASGGRWLVYSTNPATDNFGGLQSDNKATWNATYATNPPSGVSLGNHYLFSLSPTLTVTSTDFTKTYGQDAASSVAGAYTISGLQTDIYGGAIVVDKVTDFGTPTLTSNGSGIYAGVSSSPYTITAAQGSMVKNGYTLNFISTGKLTVNKADYTGIAGFKTYNGSTNFSTVAVVGVNGETFAVATATADSKDTNATHFVSSSGAISGTNLHADSNNYDALMVTNLTGGQNVATINKVPLTLAGSRVYDGGKTFDGVDFGMAGSISTGILSETISLTGSGTVGSKRVDFGAQTIAPGGFTLNNGTGGGLAINYQIAATGDTGTFTARPLTVTGLTAVDKVYNGSNSAQISGTADFSGKVGNDNLTISNGSITATFADPNAGNNKPINLAGVVLLGDDATNYTSQGVSGLTASITQAPVTLIGSRAYNGLTSFNGSVFGAISTGIGSETVTVTGTGSVGSKDVTVSPQSLTTTGLSLADGTGGGLGSNYKIAPLDNTGIITKANYTTLIGSKTYNSDASFNNVALTGVNGEAFTVQTATSNSKDVATATIFTGTSGTITGDTGAALTGNYNTLSLGELTNNTATIGRASYATLIGSKTYNGDASFSNVTLTGVNGETFTVQTASANSKDVATATIFTGTSGSITGNSGALSANYNTLSLGSLTTNTATISKANYTTLVGSKTYNGSADFSNVTLTGVNGETFTVQTVTANNKDVATATTFTGTSGTITGDTGAALTANYNILNLGSLTTNTATITKAHLTVTAEDQSKVYGDDNPTLTSTINGFVTGENLENSGVTGSALTSTTATALSDVSVGGYVITVSNGTLGASNYDFTTFTPGTLTITQVPLTVSGYGGSRLYGCDNSSIAYTGTLNGKKFLSDDVTLTASSIDEGITTASNAGTYNGVLTPGLIGAKSANYTLASSTGNLTINPAPLSVTANDASKTYDGTPYSGGNGVVYSGFVNSQNPSALSGALTYGGSSQGAVNTGSYEITPAGLTSGNYHISFIDGTLSIESAINEPKQVPVETLSSGDHGYGSTPAPLYVVTGNGVVPGAISIVVSGSNVVVSVPSDQAQSGSSFQFSLPSGVASGSQSLTVTLADGSTLPSWMSYNPADHSISASDIPEGALPVSVQIKQGDQTWTIQITAASISGGIVMNGR